MADGELVRVFHEFLDSDVGHGLYMNKINSMVAANSRRLLVDLNHLRDFDAELAKQTTSNPKEHLPAFEKALRDIVLDSSPGYLENDDDTVHVGFIGSFGAKVVSPRSLVASFLAQMVCLEGIVTKCSLVRPKMVRSVHYCPDTKKFSTREYRDATDWGGQGPTGTTYPTKDADGNPLQMEFGLSKYKANQVVTIQEMPERAPLGQLPRSVDVLLNHDLVDACKPGDRVSIVGVYRALAGQSGSTSGMFRTVLLANSVRLLSKDIQGMQLSEEDIKNIRQVGKAKGKSETAFELLSRSLAPSIYGHEYLKKAILLMLLGGREVTLENGTHLRGDINILMVGDPSTAKSQMLRFVLNIAPLAVNTTGRGSSGVGLTAAVTTDSETRERRLEAGAMVLADRGVVCIDEFDKMSDADRVAIHEVMEQQTVTIAKASIHATLNARCSVIAAANPVYGSYDKTSTPQKNVGLPDSLLSRFDLLFIVLDELDRKRDTAIANHVLRMHRYERPGHEGQPVPLDNMGQEKDDEDEKDEAEATQVFEDFNPLLHAGAAEAMGMNADGGRRRGRRGRKKERPQLLTIDFIKKFVHYAKHRSSPKLTDDARELIANEYNQLRMKSDIKTMPITARCLETIIRISTAHAKSRLSDSVTVDDVQAAMAVLKFAMYHEAEPIKKASKTKRGEREDGPGDDDDDDSSVSASRSRSASTRRSTSSSRTPAKRARRSASSSPRKGESDSDADMSGAGSGSGSGSQTPQRRSPRRSGGAGGAGAGADTPSKVDVPMDGDDASSVGGASATSDTSMHLDQLPSVAVDTTSSRYATFRLVVGRLFRSTRKQALSVNAILEAANQKFGDGDKLTMSEAHAMCTALEQENRIMYRSGIAHQI